MLESKKRWFVDCPSCGGQFAIADAIEDEPFPPNHSWKGPCPLCGEEHTYKPSEMQLGEE
jgi:endogenous inhibitor of DNA gyrase (YacG/DUF329 family)